MANHTNHHAADLIGREFGRLVVVSRAGSIRGKAAWFCRCDCLGSRIATTSQLSSGAVRSCGCLQFEHSSRQGSHVMDTHPRWRGRLLALPRYADDPIAAADHSPCRVPWERYDIVFRPDAKLLKLKRKPGRPRLPAAELERREAAKKPPGRPCQDPCKQVLRECLWRIAQAARAAGIDPNGIGRAGQRPLQSGSIAPDCNSRSSDELSFTFPEPAAPAEMAAPVIRRFSDPPSSWWRRPWSARKAAIWERARAA
jgi:hypothetical protein